MAGKGESMVPGSLRPLLIAACALLLVVSPSGQWNPQARHRSSPMEPGPCKEAQSRALAAAAIGWFA